MVAVGAQAQERESNEASVLREVTRVHSELYVLHFVLNLLYINAPVKSRPFCFTAPALYK